MTSRISHREDSFALPLALALGVHVALALAMPRNAAMTEPPPRVLELIEISPEREPPSPSPEVRPAQEPSRSATIARPRGSPKNARVPLQPTAATPPVTTAQETAIVPPLDFTTEASRGYTGVSLQGAVETRSQAAAPASAGVAGADRSRGVSVVGGREWRCPFPSEADLLGIDAAVVQLRIEVTPDGRARSVELLRDPGHGFGRAAHACAMSRVYEPALDRDGFTIRSTLLVDVRFLR